MPRAVVTGAAGFIGSRFVSQLHERGWDVTGVDVRPQPGILVGDITCGGPWTEELAGADLVVHTAAIVDENASRDAHWRVTVHGTRNVLEHAAAAGVDRFLHLSSKVVLGPDFPPGADEHAPVHPTGSPYTDAKIASEHLVLQFAAEGRVPATVVRPGDVYGPGGSQWTVRPVTMLRRRQLVLPESGRGILAPVFVDDLVDGALAAAAHPDAVGHVFFITGPHPVTAAEFFDHYGRMLGRRVPKPAIPRGVARTLGAVTGRLGRLPGIDLSMSEHTIEYVTHPGAYSLEKARRILGWTPSIGLEEGMARTRAWLEAEGYLD